MLKKENVFKTSLSKCIEMQNLHAILFNLKHYLNSFNKFICVDFGKPEV
jgi:hypothetical protein